jgi:hypothetical protein
MSATLLLSRLYKSVNAAYCDGRLPADAVVEDARIAPRGISRVLGTWDPETHRLCVDAPKARQWRGVPYVLTHELAHAATPELLHEDCHNDVFRREHDRLLGLVLNAAKRREKRFDRGDHPSGGRPLQTKLEAPLPASAVGSTVFGGLKHRPLSFSFPRRPSTMRDPQFEYADGDRPQAREKYEAIKYSLHQLEARGVPTASLEGKPWTFRRCRDGHLVAVPAPLRVRDARRRLDEQRREWSAR